MGMQTHIQSRCQFHKVGSMPSPGWKGSAETSLSLSPLGTVPYQSSALTSDAKRSEVQPE